jgi:Zn-dependent peptidase ImmA (M78 family)
MYVDARVNFRDAKSGLAVDSEEIEANQFAAELLMPKDFVVTEIQKALKKHETHDGDTIIGELAKAFDVSTQAMEYRLKNLGFLVE